jgi:hypothetical protein
MDMQQDFINFTNKDNGFWTKNRKRVMLSALVPFLLSLMNTKVAMLMFAYMYVCFPVWLFSKYAAPLVRKKESMLLRVGHKTYSVKEFKATLVILQTVFGGSIFLAIAVSVIGGPLARLITTFPYLALHLCCLWKNAPIAIIREWIKRVRFYPGEKDMFEDHPYGMVGSGRRPMSWHYHNR